MAHDLQIYYSSMAGAHHVDCPCHNWTIENYTVVIETSLTKSQLQTLRTHITPGAVGELYKVLGRPIYYDRTWTGMNTLKLHPNTDSDITSNIKAMRYPDTLIYVKNIADEPYEGPSDYIHVKIEGYISGTGAL